MPHAHAEIHCKVVVLEQVLDFARGLGAEQHIETDKDVVVSFLLTGQDRLGKVAFAFFVRRHFLGVAPAFSLCES